MTPVDVKCHWCGGPRGIACGPRLAVCQPCRDKADPVTAAIRRELGLTQALDTTATTVRDLQGGHTIATRK